MTADGYSDSYYAQIHLKYVIRRIFICDTICYIFVRRSVVAIPVATARAFIGSHAPRVN